MYEYFGQSFQTRKAAIETAAIKMGVKSIMIENDLWSSVVLKALFSEDMPDAFVLKGSTSLSKVYNITNRFSENLVIHMERSFLGPFPSTKDLVGLDWEERVTLVNKINHQAQSYFQNELVPLLKANIKDICKETIEVCTPSNEFLTIEVCYPSVLRDKALYIKPKIEINFEVGEETLYTKKPITPYLHKFIPTLAPINPEVRVLSPSKSFYEEVMILYKEAQKLAEAAPTNKIASHYYDLHQLAVKGYGKEALNKIKLLEEVVHNQMLTDKFALAEYETILTQGIKLLPSQERIPSLKTDYKKTEDLFFDYYPSMEEILSTLGEVERDINIALEKQEKEK